MSVSHLVRERAKNFLESLINSPVSTLVSAAIVWGAISFMPGLFNWLLINATWAGDSREACNRTGACWVFISSHLKQFLVGFYPTELLWRPLSAFLLLISSVAGMIALQRTRAGSILFIWLFTGYPLTAFLLIHGFDPALAVAETRLWGGILLTLVISLTGMTASLPLGVFLAMSRRSRLPALRITSTLFIEFWRGVPLITVLFMSSVMFPLLMPDGVVFNKLLRALLAITLFSSAYMAEVIRGGLQAIPSGQYEAAQALGFGYWQSHTGIILPQALKLVIPGIVNTFIGLFKDTTLITTIGMFDLLGIVQASAAHPDWLGYSLEGYLFTGLFFWACCLVMSRYSQRLELKLKENAR